jgi:glycerol-3-phosphate dehydrogenase
MPCALPSEVRPRRLYPSLDPLPGASPPDERALRSTLDAATARHLAELHGEEAGDLLGYAARFLEALERVHPAGPDLWAQIHHAADEEWAVTAEDVTRRRTTLAVRGLDAESVREGIAAVLAEGTLRSVILGPKSFNEIRPS